MTDLVRYIPPDPQEWGQLVQTAEMVVDTDFAPRQIRKSQGAIMAALLTGRELGIGPMQSLRDIYMVEGKPSLSAQLMVGLVRARGHKIRPLETTSTVARVQGVRSDDPEYPAVVEYTIEDAKQAGLAGKDVWKKYPKSMLWARAVSQLCRQMFADVLAGAAYTAEELRDGEVDEAETTVTWIEPVQDTGPQGKQAGKRGEGATQPVESAVPVQTSGQEAFGKGLPGPDQTPGAVPPGASGGPQAPQQVRTAPPAAEASANGSQALDLFRSVCETLDRTGTEAVHILRDAGWTIPDPWAATIAAWSHSQVMSAANALEKAEPGEFDEPVNQEGAA